MLDVVLDFLGRRMVLHFACGAPCVARDVVGILTLLEASY